MQCVCTACDAQPAPAPDRRFASCITRADAPGPRLAFRVARRTDVQAHCMRLLFGIRNMKESGQASKTRTFHSFLKIIYSSMKIFCSSLKTPYSSMKIVHASMNTLYSSMKTPYSSMKMTYSTQPKKEMGKNSHLKEPRPTLQSQYPRRKQSITV